MLTLIPKAERAMKSSGFISSLRKVMSAKVTNLGEFKKWKNLRDGSRLSVCLTLYRVELRDMTAYFFSDTLGRVASPLHPSFDDMKSFLSDHGYKTDHDFYVEECGMPEETYRAWNEE